MKKNGQNYKERERNIPNYLEFIWHISVNFGGKWEIG